MKIDVNATTVARLTAIYLTAFPTISSALSLSMMSSSASEARNIVVIGGGIQGSSVAYHLATSASLPPSSKITILEAKELASAASGKGGGFMARSWGDGSPTQTLHHLAFDMYEDLAEKLGCSSYRKLPVLSVSPGKGGVESIKKQKKDVLKDILPSWLDGNCGRISPMGYGDDTAQITPIEFTNKLVEGGGDAIEVILGTCTGVQTEEIEGSSSPGRRITGITYKPRSIDGDDENNDKELKCDSLIVSAGPWSCAAEDWFDGAVSLPMEGVKSTSIVWKAPANEENIDATALFCGEDYRFGTHLEVYPRPDNTIYLCGIGGSDYITTEELKAGAYREVCEAKPDRVQAASDSFQEMSAEYRTRGTLDRVQACMRPCPPDAMPYMGVIPGYQGAFINAGHNCWGIAWAPACGLAMSELVLKGSSTSVDLSAFNPARFTPKKKRGGRGRKRQGTSVGEQW